MSCSHLSNLPNIQGQLVYKDQCGKCFDSQKSENGIDICLHCFLGFCRNPDFKHNLVHLGQTGHSVVVNLKQVLIKKEKKEEENTQITKLAIGKPGGADFSDEQWEQWIEVYCHSCKLAIEYKDNTLLNNTVNYIINSSSATESESIKAWEIEIQPCEHTLTLQQEKKTIESKMNAKCADCELNSNLWICLTCGNLGCGRRQYDGSGGNNHAVEHYQKCKHPLSLKSGTITPQAVYCYQCDDDVKDNFLRDHMANFGIDVDRQVKTEKTMTELNIDVNINFTLSKTIEEGKVLKPVFGPGFTGLENLGNSCYMNSVVQCLFSLETFQQCYLDTALIHLESCQRNPHTCYYCQMHKTIWGLYSGVYSIKKVAKLVKVKEDDPEEENYQDGIRPISFKNFFGKGHPEFSSNRQQDALEYIAHLLEKIEREETVNQSRNPKKDFLFDKRTRLCCLSCGGVKYKSERTFYVNFSIPDWQIKRDSSQPCLIEECIQKWISPEEVELNCPRCKKNTKFSKTARLDNFPRYLIIVYERFVYDWVPTKLEIDFEINYDKIDFAKLGGSLEFPNEDLLPEDKDTHEEEKEPEIDQGALNTLLGMGVPEIGAKHALFNNNNNADIALNWYFENMENPEILKPLPKIKAKSSQQGNDGIQVNEENITKMEDFGFPRNSIIGALKKCNNDVERATDFLFNNPDFVFEDEPKDSKISNEIKKLKEEPINKQNGSQFELQSFITHLGKNTGSGHYVCNVKKQKEWYYYNDSKVCHSVDPPIRKGYIYFFRNNIKE